MRTRRSLGNFQILSSFPSVLALSSETPVIRITPIIPDVIINEVQVNNFYPWDRYWTIPPGTQS